MHDFQIEGCTIYFQNGKNVSINGEEQPCTRVSLKFNEKKVNEREGLYIKIPFVSSHHRPAYKHHNATWFIYHLPPSTWVVGQKVCVIKFFKKSDNLTTFSKQIGVRRSSVMINHIAKYPHLATGNWSLYDSIRKRWRNSTNLEIICEGLSLKIF